MDRARDFAEFTFASTALTGLSDRKRNGMKMVSRKESSRKSAYAKRKPYSKGQLNFLIDDLLHPFYRDCEGLRLLDGFLHAIVEGDPPVSLKKFIKYNLPAVTRKARSKNRSMKGCRR